MSKVKLTAVERLMQGMDECARARGEAQWTNGYRAGNPQKEKALHEKEMMQWKHVGECEAKFKRLCARVLSEVRLTTRTPEGT